MLYVKEVLGNIDDIVAKIEQAAKDNQFGVLDIHDLKQKMASKGVEFAPECRIIEVCNPHKAKEVLENDMAVSTALPCRISVYEEDGKWPYRTHKLNDKKWMAPAPDANLSIDVKVSENNVLNIELDDYIARLELEGSEKWQNIELKPSDFRLKENPTQKESPKILQKWGPFIDTVIGPGNSKWKGELPTLRNFRWKIYK